MSREAFLKLHGLLESDLYTVRVDFTVCASLGKSSIVVYACMLPRIVFCCSLLKINCCGLYI